MFFFVYVYGGVHLCVHAKFKMHNIHVHIYEKSQMYHPCGARFARPNICCTCTYVRTSHFASLPSVLVLFNQALVVMATHAKSIKPTDGCSCIISGLQNTFKLLQYVHTYIYTYVHVKLQYVANIQGKVQVCKLLAHLCTYILHVYVHSTCMSCSILHTY